MAFVIEPRRLDHPDAVALVDTIQDYYRELYGGHDRDATEVEQFSPPEGLFLIGYLDGAPVACGGWRRRDAGSVEIKRMYVADGLRGTGLGERMLTALEASAAAAGVRQVVLNTGFRQPDAMRFYETHGYTPTDDRYGPYASIDGAHFFAKSL
jgi:GNAT superfamily N-acetyltransferase